MTATTISAPRVDAWSQLVASTDVPLASLDDLAHVATRFPASRVPGQGDAVSQAFISTGRSGDVALDVAGYPMHLGYGDPGPYTATWEGLDLRDGRTFTARLGFGIVRLAVCDEARSERTRERLRANVRRDVDLEVAGAGLLRTDAPARTIREWSRKSRSRMVATIATLDFTPARICACGSVYDDGPVSCCLSPALLPHGMVTLTYPGDWLRAAPTGKVAKRHLDSFRRAWRDTFGWSPVGLWKQEFQRRGAPHYHLYLPIPAIVPGDLRTFERWLSETWAGIVRRSAARRGAPLDAGEQARHLLAGTGLDFATAARAGDVKRLAVYFLGHGSKTRDDKEYQHVVPAAWREPGAGPGRFWGVWGLPASRVTVDLDVDEFLAVRRVLRRVARSSARRRGRRAARTLGAGGSLVGGFVLVNDGIALALDLARYLTLRRQGLVR